MTDYLYSFSLTAQARLFLYSLGFGFLAGFVYEFFRAVRIVFNNKKWAYRITDILFLVTLGFLNCLFFLLCNEGEFRLFAVFGEALGFAVYFFTVGFAVKSFFEKAVAVLRRLVNVILIVILFPFRKCAEFLRKIVKKYLKFPQKNKNKTKYHLKVIRNLLYNLTDRKQKIRKQRRKVLKKSAGKEI